MFAMALAVRMSCVSFTTCFRFLNIDVETRNEPSSAEAPDRSAKRSRTTTALCGISSHNLFSNRLDVGRKSRPCNQTVSPILFAEISMTSFASVTCSS